MTMAQRFWGLERRARLRQSFVAISITAVVFAIGCTPFNINNVAPRPTSDPKDARFRSLFGVRIDSLARLRTDKQVYARGERISFWVYNQTGTSLYYVDRFYGLKGYVYDAEIQYWRQVYLGFFVDDPHEFVLPPAQHSYDDLAGINAFGGPGEELSQVGKIRLAVVGWTDPNNPKASEIASYTDIQIK